MNASVRESISRASDSSTVSSFASVKSDRSHVYACFSLKIPRLVASSISPSVDNRELMRTILSASAPKTS